MAQAVKDRVASIEKARKNLESSVLSLELSQSTLASETLLETQTTAQLNAGLISTQDSQSQSLRVLEARRSVISSRLKFQQALFVWYKECGLEM